MAQRRRNNLNKIYLLINKIDGKVYVGQTWYDYKYRMRKNGIGYIGCVHLYAAIQKYGIENFKYLTLAECKTQEEADKLEVYFINKYDSCNSKKGYNLKNGGIHGEMSDESKQKISKTLTGKKHSQERIEQRRKSRMESQEIQDQVVADYKAGMTIKAIKEKYNFGGNGKVYRILDNNGIERLNDFSKWTGKTHSEDTKEKMSRARHKYWQDKH